MPVSEKTRKILWVKAGGRCSICQEQLVTDPEAAEDDPSVYGEECHIVAHSGDGPRGEDTGEVDDPDGYKNLILLCRKHHKQVDDQTAYFTVQRLRQIKCDHEAREAARGGPVRLIPDPNKPTPRVLKICYNGELLWEHLCASYSFYPEWPEGLNDEQGEAVTVLLDELRDWLDIAKELSYAEGRKAAKGLGESVSELARLGIFTGVRDHNMLLVGGEGEPTTWRSFDIELQRVVEATLAEQDGTPVKAKV
jgi:hypothetical protein